MCVAAQVATRSQAFWAIGNFAAGMSSLEDEVHPTGQINNNFSTIKKKIAHVVTKDMGKAPPS